MTTLSLKAVASRAALVCMAALVALIGLELLVRLAGFDRPLVWQPDPVLGWKHIPNANMHWTEEGDGLVRINRLGMRDVERDEAKPRGVYRIAVFGDSMTEGVQVNLADVYTQQLERRLGETGLKAEVLNFGVNGYSPLQEYLLYRDVGVRFKPDLVIQAVFLDNDVADGHPNLSGGGGNAPLLGVTDAEDLTIDYSGSERSSRDYASQPMATVRNLSALYRYVWASREASRRRASMAELSRGVPRRYGLYLQPLPPVWDDAWRRLERVVVAFSHAAIQHGSRFVLLGVPAGQVVNADAWQDVLRGNADMRSKQWDLSVPEQRLAAIAGREGLTLIPATESYRQLPDRASMFFGRVGHFTPKGHAVMAGLLERWLMAHPEVTGGRQ